MPTTINCYIGTNAPTLYPSPGPNERVYTTIADWIAAIPASLVSEDQIWRGLLLNQEFLWTGSSTYATISGKTTNASCYIELTTAPDCSVFDSAVSDLSTKPLRYDGTKGARIRTTGTGAALVVSTLYFNLSKIQFSGENTTTAANAVIQTSGTVTKLDIDRCIIEGYSATTAGAVITMSSSAATQSVIRNSVVVQKNTYTDRFIAKLVYGARAYNCTFVSLGATLASGIFTQYIGPVLTNCYVGGVTAAENGTVAATRTNCYSSATGSTGYTTAAMTDCFENITIGTHDLRLKSGSPLINAGATEATYAATSIYGPARDASYDVGAWEYTAPATAPTITVQPNSTISIVSGGNGSLSLTATGNPSPTYQWQVRANAGEAWSNISGATSSTLSLNGVATSDNGKQYQCIVTNSQGSVTSDVSTLTVTVVAPEVSIQASATSVQAGTSVTYTATASGTAPLSYVWEVSTDSGANWQVIAGETSTTYTLSALMADSGKQFRSVVTNSGGSDTSNVVSLTVTPVIPSISVQPQPQSVILPAKATFSVTATNAATYQWEYKASGSSTWVAISGATSASYQTDDTTISGGTANDGDQYRVVLTSSSGGVATSNAVALTVSASAVAPTVVTQPQPQTVQAGAQATFTAVFTGTAPLTYQWECLGSSNAFWAPIDGATSASYTTPATTTLSGLGGDGSKYRCTCSNGVLPDAVTDEVLLTVTPAPVSASFSTPPIKNNNGTVLASVGSWTVNVFNATTGVLVKQVTNLSTNAQGVLTVSDSSLVAGTTYAYEPVHATYGRRLPTGTAS